MEKICQHCGYPIELRNPSGFCDHLYYPDSCEVCKGKASSGFQNIREKLLQFFLKR